MYKKNSLLTCRRLNIVILWVVKPYAQPTVSAKHIAMQLKKVALGDAIHPHRGRHELTFPKFVLKENIISSSSFTFQDYKIGILFHKIIVQRKIILCISIPTTWGKCMIFIIQN